MPPDRCTVVLADGRVLGRVELPRAPSDGEYRWRDARRVVAAVERSLGRRVVVVRWLALARDAATGRLTGTCLVQEREEAGGFREAVAWIERHCRLTGPAEQVRSWWLSELLRAPTAEGDVWLKAVPAPYRHEPALLAALAQHHPRLVPPVIAAEPSRGWTLMRHVEGPTLRQRPDLAAWERLLAAFAEAQRAFAARADDLLAWGCPDWRLGALTEREPRIAEAAAILGDTGLPDTFHHGDFHGGNVIIGPDGPVLLDWAGFVGVGHPLMSLVEPLAERGTGEGPARERLVAAYLEPWGVELDERAVEAALAVAWLPAALGHATQLAMATAPWEAEPERANRDHARQTLDRRLATPPLRPA